MAPTTERTSRTCTGLPVSIGDTLESENGNMIGPTRQGVNDLIALDPNAQWDTSHEFRRQQLRHGNPVVRSKSSRRADPGLRHRDVLQHETSADYRSSSIVNILGFFIDRMQGNDVVGLSDRGTGPDVERDGGDRSARVVSHQDSVDQVKADHW